MNCKNQRKCEGWKARPTLLLQAKVGCPRASPAMPWKSGRLEIPLYYFAPHPAAQCRLFHLYPTGNSPLSQEGLVFKGPGFFFKIQVFLCLFNKTKSVMGTPCFLPRCLSFFNHGKYIFRQQGQWSLGFPSKPFLEAQDVHVTALGSRQEMAILRCSCWKIQRLHFRKMPPHWGWSAREKWFTLVPPGCPKTTLIKERMFLQLVISMENQYSITDG